MRRHQTPTTTLILLLSLFASATSTALTSVHAETLGQLANFLQNLPSTHDAIFASGSNNPHRLLEAEGAPASKMECDTYLTLTLSTLTTECSNMASDLQSLATTSKECKRVYDFSKPKLDGICNNKCYSAMVGALDKMAASGCAPDGVTKTMCDQCPTGTTCVKGACREACSAKKACSCNNECVEGACKPNDQVGVQRAELGTLGYKLSLDHLCMSAPEQPEAYCFTTMFAALDGLTPDVCDKVATTGCCAGTVMQYGLQCALANDTMTTSMGPLRLSQLGAFCPAVDFNAKCTNTPNYSAGACALGYMAAPAEPLPFPSLDGFNKAEFNKTGIYAFIGGILGMCGVLGLVIVLQKLSNKKKLEEAQLAADKMKTQVASPSTPDSV